MKKLLSVLLASAITVTALGGLVACKKEDNSKKITVWAPAESHAAYKPLIEGFKEKYPDYKDYEIEFIAKGEGDVQGSMGSDPKAGAEVFFFASDHFGNMRVNNYLQPLTDDYAAAVKERDDQDCYEFVTDAEKIYAFPATNDNGYFLWYNSDFFTEDDVKSLDVMQAKAKGEGKHIMFDYGNSWYSPAFHIGMGCYFGYSDVEMKHYKADLQTPAAIAATKAMVNYASEEKNGPAGDDQVIVTGNLAAGLADGTYVAGISGTWETANIKTECTKAGEDPAKFKATALPKFKATIEGEQEQEYQMGSFVGGKYCGVNRAKSAEKIKVSLALADWLTNEAAQTARFNAQGAGPSNKKVAALDVVKNNVGIKGYYAQLATDKNIIQGAQSDTFWGDSGIKQLTKDIFNQAKNEAQVLDALKTLSDSLNT